MKALEYRINFEIYIPYTDADGVSLHRNGKFTIGKIKTSFIFSTANHCPFLYF